MEINKLFFDKHYEKIRDCLLEASEAILSVYHKNFIYDMKSDYTPVTIADIKASDIINKRLTEILPNIPVITEEIDKEFPYLKRKDFSSFWSVDPLDGTKHFIKKDGEFSINISLIHNNKPVLGFIYSPIEDVLYFAATNFGSFKVNELINNKDYKKAHKIHSNIPINKVTILLGDKGSKSQKLIDFEASLFNDYNIEYKYKGSSLKMCHIAEGKAHIYPRFGKTSEWDTAAAEVILVEAGAYIINIENRLPLLYNKEDFLNPQFIATSIPYKELNKFEF